MAPNDRGIFDEYLRPASPKPKAAAPRAVMLDVELPDGSRAAMPYALLTKASFKPGEVSAVFVPGTVVVEGINLDELYRALIQHRLRAVALSDDGRAFGVSMAQMARSADPVITGLRIEDPGNAGD